MTCSSARRRSFSAVTWAIAVEGEPEVGDALLERLGAGGLLLDDGGLALYVLGQLAHLAVLLQHARGDGVGGATDDAARGEDRAVEGDEGAARVPGGQVAGGGDRLDQDGVPDESADEILVLGGEAQPAEERADHALALDGRGPGGRVGVLPVEDRRAPLLRLSELG
jgi:hypothetical protein